MSIRPRQVEMFVASQTAERLGASDPLLEMIRCTGSVAPWRVKQPAQLVFSASRAGRFRTAGRLAQFPRPRGFRLGQCRTGLSSVCRRCWADNVV